ncbi:MAG: hypothetical protein GWP14_05275 [Actinobacteria bacterium]|nr:hypothetical protein [Actinomycetota bacterium]
MRRIMLGLLIVVLVAPAVALARVNEDIGIPSPGGAARAKGRLNLEMIRGEIISITKNEVVIATGPGGEQEQITVRIPKINRAESRALLAQGIGQQAQLRCWKKRGVLTLVRIKDIEGVDVSSQPGFSQAMREKLRDRAQQLSPEDRERFRERFKGLRERLSEDPELREELKELAKDDPDAFRQRIRQMMPELQQRPGRGGPQQDEGPGGMSDQRGPGMMGGRMGPRGRQGGGRRFSPEDKQLQKLERQTRELAERYRRAEDEEKGELSKKLRETLLETFEAKVQLQNQQVEHLEKQLQKLRSRLEKRQKNREAIINQRFGQLTGQQDDELAW